MTSRNHYWVMISVVWLCPPLFVASETYSTSMDSSLYGYALKNSTPLRTGFLAYDPNAATSRSHGLIDLEVFGDASFIVNFPEASSTVLHSSMKCVRFDTNGSVEVTNVTVERLCVGRRQGHYSVVVMESKGGNWRKPWKLGIGIGFVGLVLVAAMVMICRWCCKRRAMEKMEESDGSVALGSVWIGTSRMPAPPAGMRTHPVLENDDMGPQGETTRKE